MSASACGTSANDMNANDMNANDVNANANDTNADNSDANGSNTISGLGIDDSCGVAKARKCEEHERCSIDDDCNVGSCVLGTCNAVATECTTDVGSALKRCDGVPCTTKEQCASGYCNRGTCLPVGTKTCGVGFEDACDDGEVCQSAADCVSDYCDKMCAPPPDDVHSNGKRDGGEIGIDCGGSVRDEQPCQAGQACLIDDDCESLCDDDGLCTVPSATDGKKNQGETDIDCGGPDAPPCTLDKACERNEDCLVLACTAAVCVKPTSNDNVQNGGETDVNCGGSGVVDGNFSYIPPRCKDGKICAVNGDCMTSACSSSGTCVAPSCNTDEVAGITSCGADESNKLNAVQESCCKSLPLPKRTTRRLDKYEITAGRFRTFLTKVGPNVRSWVSTFAAANPTSQLATFVKNAPNLINIYPQTQSGPLGLTAHMSLDIDNYGGIRGCYNGNGDYGANTYWQESAKLAEYGIPERSLLRLVSDEKPLNCAMPIMFAAFCAWDGGELAMKADYQDVWTMATNAYPFPAANVCVGGINKPCPNYNWCNGTYNNGGLTCQNTDYNLISGAGVFYEYPRGTDRAKDNEVLIAAPGRMIKDASNIQVNGESWMDLFANMVEYTGDFSGTGNDFCDFSGAPAAGATTCTRSGKAGTGTRYTGIPSTTAIGRSWEGHAYEAGTTTLQVTFQYGKFGGRCARPVQ
jgi:hypothetical protein